MRKTDLAASDAVEQEESIQVDMDAKDGEGITRRPARGSVIKPKSQQSDFNVDEWEQKNRHVKKRLAQQARSFNQQMADQEAEHKRQLAIRDARLDKLERGGQTDDQADAAHQKVMDEFEAKIAAAQEEGDSKLVASLTRAMSTSDAKFWSEKTARATGSTAKIDANKNGGAAGDGTQARASVIQPSKEGQKWAKANEDWFDDKTDRTCVAARAFANALYKDKIDAGEDKDEAEFYEEIRKEVEKRFPELETVSTLKSRRQDPDDDDDDDDVQQRQRQEVRRPTSLSIPDRGDATKNRGNRLATITAAEQREMKKVGLDPLNNKHVMQYVRERNQMEQEA